MKLSVLPFFTLLFLLSAQLFSQSPLIIGNGQFQIDDLKKLILVTKQSNHTAILSSVQLGSRTFATTTPIDPIEAGTPYTIKSGDMLDYTLYFTDNPIVSITVSDIGDINRDDEIIGSMTLATTIDLPYESVIGIKIRGASSSTFPKKSYRVQLKRDDDPSKNREDQLLGMRVDKRWLMFAMYNEPMRNNNKFSHDLWLDMHEPYYLDRESEALSTIRSKYVEAFVNKEYRGIYLFTEDADQKQFKLKGKNEGGELYKGEDRGSNNTFIKDYPLGGMHNDYPGIASSSDELWGGWELRHPGSTDWTAIYDFTQFVIESNNGEFKEHIGSKLHLDNVIDYFIFVNVIKASDNEAKNTLFGKYAKDEPYFYGVWDLDGVIGTYWNGNKDPMTTEILVNNLFVRLLDTDPQNFKLRLALRWKTLRQGLLSTASFKSRFFGLYQYLLLQGVYARELLVMDTDEEHNPWNPDIFNFGQNQVDYVNNWIDSRFSYLDNYFNYMYETALPIKLSSFNLNNSENKVKIEWSVAEAVNVSYFTAERSLSGKDRWISLGNVAYTEGKSGYHLIDGSPIPGTSYYRLKTTDLDGNFEYSTIRSITTTRTTDNAGSFYPNPAKGILKYKTKVTQRKISSISFLNAYGIPVLNEVNSPEHSFDVGNILPGIYIAIVSFEDGGREHHRIAITN